jgi:biopolymer transport protein ExbD
MAGTTFQGSGRRGGITGINVTPMVDIMLVLLVIMMVSANFIVSQAMNVDLPKAANGDRATPSVAIVVIQADGTYGWNDKPVTEPQLALELSHAHDDNPDVNVVVSGDTMARHGQVVHVLDLAKAAGITHFAIAVEQSTD